jgi:hypothetical protein
VNIHDSHQDGFADLTVFHLPLSPIHGLRPSDRRLGQSSFSGALAAHLWNGQFCFIPFDGRQAFTLFFSLHSEQLPSRRSHVVIAVAALEAVPLRQKWNHSGMAFAPQLAELADLTVGWTM